MQPTGWDIANTLVSLAIGLITLLGLLGTGFLAFRKKIKAAWARTTAVLNAAEQIPQLMSDNAALHETVSTFQSDIGQVRTMAEQVQKAVLPNSGGSIPDKLNQMVVQAEHRDQKLDTLGRKIDNIGNTMRATQNADTRLATFDADEDGRCTYVNRTYLRWTGLPLSEIVGWGWMNAVHPDDRADVRRDWDAAVRDARRYQGRYRMVSADGVVFAVECSAEPIPEGAAPAERWVGSIIRLAGT